MIICLKQFVLPATPPPYKEKSYTILKLYFAYFKRMK